MYKIYLDMSDRNNRVIKLIRLVNEAEELVEELMGEIDPIASIESLLKKHDICVDQVGEIVPSLGPGSFTGLKIGVTTANVFNWLKGKKSLRDLDLPNYGADPNIWPVENS